MNNVILMGRLTRDPEVRYTQTNNTLVASFSLAVNRRFVRQGEERREKKFFFCKILKISCKYQKNMIK